MRKLSMAHDRDGTEVLLTCLPQNGWVSTYVMLNLVSVVSRAFKGSFNSRGLAVTLACWQDTAHRDSVTAALRQISNLRCLRARFLAPLAP